MAEDPKISRRYRELPREEPSPQIDAAILAASRRAAETRPAPLVVPTGRRRWYFPLAAAAIIVLAVAVTVQVERRQPDPEIAVAPVTVPEAQREEQAAQSRILKEEPVQPAPARKAAPMFTPDPKPEAPPELPAQRDAAPAERQAAPAPEPASPPVPQQPGAASGVQESAPADAVGARRRSEIQRAPAPETRAMAKLGVEPPEQWLERIAELRKQGKHEEADKALAEFRRAYPEYRISEAMLEKVEKK
jgi:outer membrane biosynthesis protein TonB